MLPRGAEQDGQRCERNQRTEQRKKEEAERERERKRERETETERERGGEKPSSSRPYTLYGGETQRHIQPPKIFCGTFSKIYPFHKTRYIYVYYEIIKYTPGLLTANQRPGF